MALIFSDGVEIKNSGPFRIIEELDGLYVAASGMLIPVSTRQEGEETHARSAHDASRH